MKRLSNTLELEVVLAVYDDRVDFIQMNCSRLRWVSEAGASAALPMQALLQDEMVADFNEKGATLESVEQAMQRAGERLTEHLAADFSIYCSVHLHVILEEQTSKGFASLAERLEVSDPEVALQQLNDRNPLVTVDRKPLDEIAIRNGEQVTDGNFRLLEREIQVIPGKPIHFTLGCEEPVRCLEVRLSFREIEVLRYATTLRLEANSLTPVHLPTIPAGKLHHLTDSGNDIDVRELAVHLMIDGRGQQPLPLTETLRYSRVVLIRPPVALFLDIGSAFSKFCVVELEGDPAASSASETDLSAQLRQRLTIATNNGGAGVSLDAPTPTAAFLDLHGLPHTPKATLDLKNDDELAAHFSNGISRLAERYYLRENRLIADVYWAFPNTERRDFEKITGGINHNHGGVILGAARLVPEADCLQASFSGVLVSLAKAAREAKATRISAKKTNRNLRKDHARAEAAWDAFENQWWLPKLWTTLVGKRPQNPRSHEMNLVNIPSLEAWHREFTKVACAEGLSDFLVIDAGGYSLDVFATFSGPDETFISKSFNAGSAKINAALVKELKKSFPDHSKQEHEKKAEEVKCYVCGDPDRTRQHSQYVPCEVATEKVYGKYIDGILDSIAPNSSLKSFPVILTGGGSRNQFLQRMIRRKLKERRLLAVPVNSPLLYSTSRRAHEVQSSEMRLFLCMASAFHPEETQPRMAPFTDILGGLVQLALNAGK